MNTTSAPSVLLVLLGRNAGGKGTVVKILNKLEISTHGMSTVLTGLREDPEIGKIISHHMDNAQLVPCDITSWAFCKYYESVCLSKEDYIRVFEGACRTAEQVILKMNWLKKKYPNTRIIFVELMVTHEIAMARAQARLQKAIAKGEKPRGDDIPERAISRSQEYDYQRGILLKQITEMFPGQLFHVDYNEPWATPEYAAATIYSLIFPGIGWGESTRRIAQFTNLAVA